MAVESKQISLGFMAPDFSLKDVVSGKDFTLNQIRGTTGTVVYFICNHCPYVKHVEKELVNIAKDYQAKGIGFVAISSNDILRYPEDSPEKLKEQAQKLGFSFPYLFDETQEVAKSYQAECTPDIYVFDKSLRLFYHGQLDDSRPGNGIPVTGFSLRNALDLLIEGKAPPERQRPSIGCSIKWKTAF